MTPFEPTPAMVHQFDQDLAAINATITELVTAYHAAKDIYNHPEIVMGIATALQQNDHTDGEALAQHLAVAITRIAELENGITQIVNDITQAAKGNHSSASNSEPQQPNAGP